MEILAASKRLPVNSVAFCIWMSLHIVYSVLHFKEYISDLTNLHTVITLNGVVLFCAFCNDSVFITMILEDIGYGMHLHVKHALFSYV